MKKIVLLTGSTTGISLETAKAMVSPKHHVLLHACNPLRLEGAER